MMGIEWDMQSNGNENTSNQDEVNNELKYNTNANKAKGCLMKMGIKIN